MKEKIQEQVQMVEMELTLIEIQDKMTLKKTYLGLKINPDLELIQFLLLFLAIVVIISRHLLKKQKILILKVKLIIKKMNYKNLKITKKL